MACELAAAILSYQVGDAPHCKHQKEKADNLFPERVKGAPEGDQHGLCSGQEGAHEAVALLNLWFGAGNGRHVPIIVARKSRPAWKLSNGETSRGILNNRKRGAE